MTKTKRNTKNDTPEKEKDYKKYPRSYRLDAEMIAVLKDTLHRINQVSPRKVSEARLVKALIVLSQEMDEETLTKGLKQVW